MTAPTTTPTALTEQEQAELVRLMGKLTFPLPLEVFYAWSKTFPTTAAELLVMRNIDSMPEVLLTYRKDRFYDGWHVPGSIHRPNEKFEDTIGRVITGEVGLPATTPYGYWRWFQYPIGTGAGESPRGDVISLLFIMETGADNKAPGTHVVETAEAKFFPLGKMPPDLIPIQIPLMDALKAHYDLL